MPRTNTQSSKQLLEAALQNLPVNRHTSDVRTHIHRAINEIERVERKDFHKAQQQSQLTPSERWKLDLETGQLISPMNPKAQLGLVNKIDEMIEAEKKKIENLKNKPSGENQNLMG